MEYRIEQVNNLIQKIMAGLIAKHFCVTRDMVISLTRVKVSGNLQEAKIFISVIPDREREKIVGALNGDVVYFQKILNEKLRMRPVPRIEFVADETPEAAQQVETILEELKKQQKN